MNKKGGLSFTLHRESYSRIYVTRNVCSIGFLFHVFVLTIVLVFPFLLTFTTGCKDHKSFMRGSFLEEDLHI